MLELTFNQFCDRQPFVGSFTTTEYDDRYEATSVCGDSVTYTKSDRRWMHRSGIPSVSSDRFWDWLILQDSCYDDRCYSDREIYRKCDRS